MSKFGRGGVDLGDHTLGAATETHQFATPIILGALARDPTISFEPMQQRHKGRFFDSEAGGDFFLSESVGCDRQMK